MHKEAITNYQDSPALCSLTKKVMLISRVPERVQQLLLSLSKDCFDVFSLHEFDEAMLSSIKPDIMIYDALGNRNVDQEYGRNHLNNASLHQIPLIILMSEEMYRNKEYSEILGAESMVWPSSVDQTVAHINRLITDQSRNVKSNEDLIFKDLAIDTRRMIVKKNRQRIELTKTEYDLLLHFLTSDGSVQTRETLLDVIWGLQFYAGSNVVDVHIKSLRKKLADSAVDPNYIVTVRGVGYRLADV